MDENQVRIEAKTEFCKKEMQLAEDLISEANQVEDLNGRTKHLMKRLGIHQLILAKRARHTNTLLLILSLIMAIGSVFTVLTYFKSSANPSPQDARAAVTAGRR